MSAPRREQTPERTKDLGPPWTGTTEKATLLGILDYLRSSITGKVANVPEPEVRTSGVPSGTNLLGLIKHLTYVERFYFLGEPSRHAGHADILREQIDGSTGR